MLFGFALESVAIHRDLFAVNGDSLAKTKKSHLTLSPNPMVNQTTFKFDRERSNSKLMLFDSFGRLVKTVKAVEGAEYVLKHRNLAAGVYFYYFEHSNGDVDRGKLSIQ